MNEKIWVIAEHYGSEGFAEPFMAFLDRPTAMQCMELLGKCVGGTSARLIEVPIWKTDAQTQKGQPPG